MESKESQDQSTPDNVASQPAKEDEVAEPVVESREIADEPSGDAQESQDEEPAADAEKLE